MSLVLGQHVEEGVFALHNRPHRVGGINSDRLQFAHQQQTENLVKIAGSQYNALNGRIAQAAGMQLRCRFNLRAQVGRSVQQKPMLIVGGNGNLDLRPGYGVQQTSALTAAVEASTIPLWKAATGRRTQNFNAHCWLDFRRRVAVDFASHADHFKGRRFPLHDRFPRWSGLGPVGLLPVLRLRLYLPILEIANYFQNGANYFLPVLCVFSFFSPCSSSPQSPEAAQPLPARSSQTASSDRGPLLPAPVGNR